MRISELFSLVGAENSAEFGVEDEIVAGLKTDSRKVQEGDVFIALKGHLSDGHDFVDQAFRRGATLALVERTVDAEGPCLVVEDLRLQVGRIASRFFGDPTSKLKVIGITGTNGKTTTAYICHQILTQAGFNPSLVGTVATIVNGQGKASVNTTPGPIELQRIAAETVACGGKALVMEVSSHGLEQGRVAGVEFDAAVFTNLTQDHLDYHGTFANYRASKGKLFEMLKSNAVAILNDKDPASDFYQSLTRAQVRRFGFSSSLSVCADIVRKTLGGSELMISVATTLQSTKTNQRLLVPFVGDHNIENCLAAIAACLTIGAESTQVFQAIEACRGIPGRLERVSSAKEPAVFVDYAHTDDALDKVLRTLRPLTKGRLSVVFGCGGDRDKGKRPKMGQAAARWADQLIVTSDNPRSEEPSAIVKQIMQGIHRSQCHVEIDRAAAIQWAIEHARHDDVVLIAGKGHEQTQVFADHTIEFCDRQTSQQVLSKLAEER